MTHPFDIMPLAEGGSLIFTPCPGTKDVDLRNALHELKTAGTSAVITMMPRHELAEHGVADIEAACTELGLQWFHFPVEDDAAPEHAFHTQWAQQSATILNLLSTGNTIAVHCKGGSGRTGLMVALLLRARGETLENATQSVQAIRPKSLQLTAHRDFLASFPL